MPHRFPFTETCMFVQIHEIFFGKISRKKTFPFQVHLSFFVGNLLSQSSKCEKWDLVYVEHEYLRVFRHCLPFYLEWKYETLHNSVMKPHQAAKLFILMEYGKMKFMYIPCLITIMN